MKSKSPFFVKQQFISPLKCEGLLADLIPMAQDVYTLNENALDVLYNQYVIPLEDEICEHYDMNIIEYEKPSIYRYENSGYADGCDAFTYINQKWLKTKDRDLSYTLFLSDYQDSPSFDRNYEIYGGKIEYPQHNFGFNQQRGTLIVHPSTPHFIHHMNMVTIGVAYVVKWYAKSDPYVYDFKNFPGDYRVWFKELS